MNHMRTRRFLNILFCLVLLFLLGSESFGANRFVYSRFTGNYWQIWIADASGRNHRQLTDGPGDKKKPVWLPDGQIVFLDNHGKLWCFGLKKKIKKPLFPGMQVDSCAPGPTKADVLMAVYETSGRDISHIWMGDMSTGKGVKLTRGGDLNRSPVLVPGSDKIIYTLTGKRRDSKLMVTNLEGTSHRDLLDNSFHNLSPSVSPDGRYMVFAANASGNYDLWVMTVKGDSKQQITRFEGLDTDPRWSPERDEILFVSTRGGSPGIWKTDSSGSKPVPVTPKNTPAKDPWWEPKAQGKEVRLP